ncbi:MAG: thiamine pyrophosphate-dependent enzyme, partial [Solirubrobacteraceae bacterium]
PLFHRVRDDARIARIDIDPLKLELGLWSFPTDLLMDASTAATLPLLTALVQERRTAVQSARAQERQTAIAAAHRRRQEELAGAGDASGGADGVISAAHLARCVAEMVDEQTIVVDDSTTAVATNAEHIPTLFAGSYFQPIGSSMGWGAGASLGAKLAAPDKTVISLNAEGNFFSGAPEAALWGAARLDAPFLTVVYDNSQYAAIKLGVGFEYPDSALSEARLLDLERPPDISGIARSCDAHAERIADAAELPAALTRGLETVRGGQSAVIDVAIAGP